MSGGDSVAAKVWRGEANPGELAAYEQARKAAQDDLRALRISFAVAADATSGERAAAWFTLGLHKWDHLHLAMALAEALTQLEQRRATS